jgi:hypothetical protein
MGKKKLSATTMATDIIELPEPVATPIGRPEDRLKQEFHINWDRWEADKTWSLDQALKLFVGIDPDKFDPSSEIHLFYLNTLNVAGLARRLAVINGGALPSRAEIGFWLGLLREAKRKRYELSELISEVMVSAKEPTPPSPANTRQKFSDEQAREAHEKYIKGRDTYPKVTLESIAHELGVRYQALTRRWKKLGLRW